MRANFSRSNNNGALCAFITLLIFVGLVYSNSLDAIWTLDDDPKILQNTRLHIGNLLPETLFQTFFSPLHPDESGQPRLNRPLAHLSFALNWYFWKNSPAGYRLVNIFIHFLTAFVLFLVIRALLHAPNLRGAYDGHEDFIALLGSALWAVNPIQTQAVVYIVQRMASMSCFFYLLGIWGYIRGRMSTQSSRQARFILLAVGSFLAAVGSKENAVLLPAALVLLEFIFFQNLSLPSVRRRFSYILCFSLCLLLIGGGWLFSSGKLDALLDYSIRMFTPWERLLTQPRIVLFYLSQIFYPVPSRLSMVHDVELSRSLIEPWTTLPAILGILALICFGVWQMRKRPMLSFAILFFFLNQVIESSVIGLELIYEHRNYLPSLFLFAPVAIGLQSLIEHFRAQGSTFHRVVSLFILLLIASLGAGTYIRNLAWLDPKTFWEDAAHKAPLSMRPLHNLAYYHYEKRGEYKKAYELYQQEIGLRSYNRQELSSAHVNLANYYYRQGEFNQAIEHLSKAYDAFPDFALVRYLQAYVFFKAGQHEKALTILRPLVADRRNSFDDHYLMAEILLQTGNREDAMAHLQDCLRIVPDSARAQTLMRVALSKNADTATPKIYSQDSQ